MGAPTTDRRFYRNWHKIRLVLRRIIAVFVVATATAFAACSSFQAETVDASSDAAVDARDAAEEEAPDVAVDDGADGRATSEYALAILADGPKAYWRMGAVTGGIVIPDETGGGNALTLVGSGYMTGAPGAFADDPAVYFSATAEAHAAKPGDLDFSGMQPSFTLECWARQVNPDAGIEAFPYLVSHVSGSDDDKSENGYFLYFRNDLLPATITAEVAAAGNITGYVTAPTMSEDWTHYALVVENGGATIYVDGAPKDTQSFTGTVQADPQRAFVVGGSTREPDLRHFTGYIDEVAVYAKALDAVAIAGHHGLRH